MPRDILQPDESELLGSGDSDTIPLNRLALPVVAGATLPSATTGQVPVSNGDGTWSPGAGVDVSTLVTTTDSRLSNPRTPTAHKTTHAIGGSDPLSPADIGAATASNLSNEISARIAVEALKADLVGGVIPTSQLPSLSIGDTITVASQAAMLALTTIQVQVGDVAIRTDLSGARFILTDSDPSILAHWIELDSSGAVTSVNGQTGVVVLSAANVGAASTSALTTETSARTAADALKADATALTTEASTRAAADTAEATARSNADALLAPLASPTFTGTPRAPTPGNNDNSTKIATTAYVDAHGGGTTLALADGGSASSTYGSVFNIDGGTA